MSRREENANILEASQTIRHQTGGFAVFLRHSNTSSPRICMPGLALQPNGCADKRHLSHYSRARWK